MQIELSKWSLKTRLVQLSVILLTMTTSIVFADASNPEAIYMGYIESDAAMSDPTRDYMYTFRSPSDGTRVGLRDEDQKVVGHSTIGSNTWWLHEFPRTVCLNNTNANLVVNDAPGINRSKKLLIYFQGGNACFDAASCSKANWKNGYSLLEFANHLSSNGGEEQERDASRRHTYDGLGAYDRGIFNRSSDDNPFKDYNYVTIPYCTGDAYMGSAGTEEGFDEADLTHIESNNIFLLYNHKHIFRGYYNVKEFMKWIVDNYPDMEEVVVMGQSAGAIGASYHFNSIYQDFNSRAEHDGRTDSIAFSLIDESGFTLLDKDVKNCAQAGIRHQWHMDEGLNNTIVRSNMNLDWSLYSQTGEFMDLISQQNFKLPVNISYIRSEADVTLSTFYSLAEGTGKSEAGCTDNGIRWFSSNNLYPSSLLGTRSVTENFHNYIVNLPSDTVATVRSWLVPAKRHQWILGPDAGTPALEPWKIDMPWADWQGYMPDSIYYYPYNSNSILLSDWLKDMLDSNSPSGLWNNYRIPRQLCRENDDLGDRFYKSPGVTPPFPDDGKFMEMCDGA